MNERRSEVRLLCSELITLRVEDNSRWEGTVNLEDISASGACVQLEQPVRRSAKVTIWLGGQAFGGTIRHCTHNEIGFFAGIQFDAGTSWSRAMYEPMHLFDPMQVTQLLSRAAG
ncbi:MAG: PilZ domain-containing protein [Bryobacteraceae bacterium]